VDTKLVKYTTVELITHAENCAITGRNILTKRNVVTSPGILENTYAQSTSIFVVSLVNYKTKGGVMEIVPRCPGTQTKGIGAPLVSIHVGSHAS
jgi:hypothetical protein